jgi:hypothetical protein
VPELLVVVDDLDIVSVGADEAEADPPLIVDANAVLPQTVASKFFETVRGRDLEVEKTGCGVEHQQLAKRHSLEVRRRSTDPFAPEKSFRVRVAKAANHSGAIDSNAIRYYAQAFGSRR